MNGNNFGNASSVGVGDKPNFVTAMNSAVGETRGLMARMQSLSERLVGAVPENGEAKLEAVPTGVFGEVETGAGQIDRMIQRTHEFITRIEQALPND